MHYADITQDTIDNYKKLGMKEQLELIASTFINIENNTLHYENNDDVDKELQVDAMKSSYRKSLLNSKTYENIKLTK